MQNKCLESLFSHSSAQGKYFSVLTLNLSFNTWMYLQDFVTIAMTNHSWKQTVVQYTTYPNVMWKPEPSTSQQTLQWRRRHLVSSCYGFAFFHRKEWIRNKPIISARIVMKKGFVRINPGFSVSVRCVCVSKLNSPITGKTAFNTQMISWQKSASLKLMLLFCSVFSSFNWISWIIMLTLHFYL